MKKLLIILAIAISSCTASKSVVTAKVVDVHIDDLRRSKSYVVLSTKDTLICADKQHNYEIGNEYTFTFTNGFRKQLK